MVCSGEILQALSEVEHWAEVENDVILAVKKLPSADKSKRKKNYETSSKAENSHFKIYKIAASRS